MNGLLLYYCGTPVAWKSGRQKIRSESTCQAEWIACAEGLKWVERMGYLSFFSTKYDQTVPIPPDMTLWTDSESVEACSLAVEAKPASRHFILRNFKVREFSDKNPERLRFCRTEYQRADALTKAADINQHDLILGKSTKPAFVPKVSFVALFDAGILEPVDRVVPKFPGPLGKNALASTPQVWDHYWPNARASKLACWASFADYHGDPPSSHDSFSARGQTYFVGSAGQSDSLGAKRAKTAHFYIGDE